MVMVSIIANVMAQLIVIGSVQALNWVASYLVKKKPFWNHRCDLVQQLARLSASKV